MRNALNVTWCWTSSALLYGSLSGLPIVKVPPGMFTISMLPEDEFAPVTGKVIVTAPLFAAFVTLDAPLWIKASAATPVKV
jgi:hypothetical protein